MWRSSGIDVSDGLTKSEEEDVTRGLHCLPLQPAVDDEQTARTDQYSAVRHHRRQRSSSFDE